MAYTDTIAGQATTSFTQLHTLYLPRKKAVDNPRCHPPLHSFRLSLSIGQPVVREVPLLQGEKEAFLTG